MQQTKANHDQPLDYARPSEPNNERAFNGMVVGVIAGWFSGIAFAIVACSAMHIENSVDWIFTSLILAIISAAGGGWIGRQIRLSR